MDSQIEPRGSETSTVASAYSRADAADDDSFVRHHTYYFKDGNVTFLVDGTLYCVHQYFFSRDSVYFSTRFDQLGIRDHEFFSITISLSDIERKDFETFLSILYPDSFEEYDLSYEEWKSVLHLSTRWDFASIRRLALDNIQPPAPLDRLRLARTYSINDWVTPALSALCERSAPLTLDEARQMNIEDVVLVATVREDICNHALQIDVAEIPRRVEAVQARKPDSFDVSLAGPASGAVGKASSSVSQKQFSKGHDSDTNESDGEVPEESEVPRTIGVLTGELAQIMKDSQADVTTNVVMHNAEDMPVVCEKEREAKEAAQVGVAKVEIEAEEAKGKTEAAGREVNGARPRRLINLRLCSDPGRRYSQLGNPYFHE